MKLNKKIFKALDENDYNTFRINSAYEKLLLMRAYYSRTDNTIILIDIGGLDYETKKSFNPFFGNVLWLDRHSGSKRSLSLEVKYYINNYNYLYLYFSILKFRLKKYYGIT